MKQPTSFVAGVLFAALLVATGCGREKSRAGIRDSGGARIVESGVPAWSAGREWRVSAAPVLEIGAVAGDGTQQLHQVSAAARLSDERIVVAQRDHLRLFGRGGDFISQIGRAGQGPGEFAGPILQLVVFPGDTIGVWNGRRVMLFSAAGVFARSVDYPVRDILAGRVSEGATSLLLADGSALFRIRGSAPAVPRSEPGTYRSQEGIVRYVPAQPAVDTVGFFPGREDVVMRGGEYSIPPVRHQTMAASAGDRLYIGDNAAFDIRVFELPASKGGTPSSEPMRLVAIARPGLSRKPVTSDDREAFAIREREPPSATPPAQLESRRQWAERYIAAVEWPAAYPAFLRLVVDREGNLWMLQETVTGGESTYAVLDRSGLYLGQVTLPPRLVPFDIGRDYVVGLWTNDDRVNFVRVHSLAKPDQ